MSNIINFEKLKSLVKKYKIINISGKEVIIDRVTKEIFRRSFNNIY